MPLPGMIPIGAEGPQTAIATIGLTHIGAAVADASALDDGDEDQSHTQATRVGNGNLFWQGWDLASAKYVTGARAVASNNRGFKENASGAMTFQIRGHTASPAAATDGTLIGTVSGTDANSVVFQNLQMAGLFRYVWLTMQTSDTGTSQVAELVLYETVP